MEALTNFIHGNGPVLSLLALAFVVTMREELPPPFNRVQLFCWLYGWIHDGLKTFVSFRSPSAVPPKDAARDKDKQQ
jgi:hypothetical protein